MVENPRLLMVLESLCDLSSHGWLWVELYANYDCDASSPDILIPLCTLLSKCATSEYMPLENIQVVGRLQLTAVHCLLNGMRLLVTKEANEQQEEQAGTAAITTTPTSATVGGTDADADTADTAVTGADVTTVVVEGTDTACAASLGIAERLRQSCLEKKELQKAGDMFNLKPKKGILFLEQLGLLCPEHSVTERAATIGHFLRNTSNLEKEKIGEYIGHGDDAQMEAVRQAYVSTFNVEGRSVVSSLRMFLGKHFDFFSPVIL